MSKLRPTLKDADPKTLVVRDGTALLMILNAVKTRGGLVHGKLDELGEHCAIGSFFHVNKAKALPSALIDEVAAVNDSVPGTTPRRRKLIVQKWLRWKLSQLGLKGV